MARMHARKRGKSSSKRPLKTKNPKWVPAGKKEIEEVILKLAGQGLSTAEIGARLRDQYAVPSVKLATGKSLTQILRDKKITFDIPEDLANLMRKAVSVNNHLKKNPKDVHNRRGLELIEAKIRRLVRYYQGKGLLSAQWRYSRETAELQVK